MAKQDRPQQRQTREHPARPTVDKQATRVVSRPVPHTERSIETQAKSLGDRRAGDVLLHIPRAADVLSAGDLERQTTTRSPGIGTGGNCDGPDAS